MGKTIEDIQAKSEEVQSIIDRMPTKWARYISFITGTFICLVVVAGFIIRYPDTVDGQISVTASIAPVRLIANTSGRLHLLKPNKSILRTGDVIAYIESGANYEDILLLDSLLKQYTLNSDTIEIPFSLTLGDLAPTYNSFVKAYTEYSRITNSDIYTTMREILQHQIETDKSVVANMELELILKEQILSNSAIQLEKDKVLLSMKAITEDEYEEKLNYQLLKEEERVSLESSRLSKRSEINKNRLEIQRIVLEEREMMEKTLYELMSAVNSLTNMIYLWKEKYLQYATFDGELEYLSFWRENSFVSSGQELFSIIPEENDVVGEVIIPSIGAGKVEIGQTVNVKINKFPYDEYGLLKGRVEALSRISNKIETSEGVGEVYQVIISFPDGFISNYGISLSLDFESKGTAEIITKPKRLIERLFDNLKAKTDK
jgi:hypothetical protein